MTQKRFFDSDTHPHLSTLVLATAFGPLAMNIFLPSLPNIAAHFAVDYVVVQFAVTLYLISNAAQQLVIGPLSDRFGRRPVLLTFFSISLAATLVAIFAPNITVFLIARAFQGTAIAGMVICRAAIRDMVGPDQAASMIGYVTMGMTLAPMLGPVAGGYLETWFDWRAAFWLLFVFGLGVALLVWADFGETSSYRGAGFRAQFAQYPRLFASRRFWAYASTCAFSSGAFFAFIGGAPYLATNQYGMGPSEYGFSFACVGAGYLFGNFLSGRYATLLGINAMMFAGTLIAVVGLATCLLLVSWDGYDTPLIFFGSVMFVGIGNGVTLPSANAGIVSVRPEVAGTASGLGGFLQIGGGAVLSVAGGVFLTPNSGSLPLVVVMLGSSLIAALTAAYVIRRAKTVGELESATKD